MHFDIVVPEQTGQTTVHTYGENYLVSKQQGGQPLTAKECQFCHVEEATQEMITAFNDKGYFIIEMQNCN